MADPQYAILRFAKYKGRVIGRIEAHNERTKDSYTSNPDIDPKRTHLNFHLVTPQRKYRAEAEKCDGKINISTGVGITCEPLRQELDAGRPIILETIIPGDADGIHDRVLHWIVVYGYEGDLFHVCDPLSSKIKLTAQELEHYMDTPIGKIYISVGEDKQP